MSPWRVRKLYWTSFAGPSTVRIATDGKAKGALTAASPGQSYAAIGFEAARQHRSQGFDRFLASLAKTPGGPPARPNGFLLIKSRILANPREEKDLFDGIAGAKLDGQDAAHDVLASSLAPDKTPPIVAQLRPRDQIVEYRDWLKANGLSRLRTRLPARATVVQGRADNPIVIEITNATAERRTGKVSVNVPDGWKLEKTELAYDVAAQSSAVVAFRCTVPADAAVKGHDVTVRLGDTTETGQLDVVPTLLVKRLTAAMPVDAEIGKWESAKIAATPIPPTNVVQGRIEGPKECGGRFFVAYDERGIQVLVDVTDDTVARNIAPDDIKAHWRSTSIELCLDPTPRSENTFTAFKLGIFPQDTTGKVRAARDADANPGPLEQIKSNIRLASRLTATGYVVEVHIPWSEAGVAKVEPGKALGFNVILYHAGKKEARVGEDIGKSRLAWSFWPGVPGRPEVGGSATLE